MLIEVCANSLQSAINAEAAGADRIELCSELGVGGITPSHGLIKMVKEKIKLPVHVLVRPRSGHFTYSKTEFEVMKQDVECCKEIGVEGIVSGVLHTDFSVDVKRTKELVDMANPLKFVFHRAFDWVSDPGEAIKQLQAIGVDAVLSSGQETTAGDGLKKLRAWQAFAKNMTLMAGGGIHPDNAKKFKAAGLRALHLSGTSFGEAISLKGKIPMNSQKHLNETKVAVTNAAMLRQVIQSVK